MIIVRSMFSLKILWKFQQKHALQRLWFQPYVDYKCKYTLMEI